MWRPSPQGKVERMKERGTKMIHTNCSAPHCGLSQAEEWKDSSHSTTRLQQRWVQHAESKQDHKWASWFEFEKVNLSSLYWNCLPTQELPKPRIVETAPLGWNLAQKGEGKRLPWMRRTERKMVRNRTLLPEREYGPNWWQERCLQGDYLRDALDTELSLPIIRSWERKFEIGHRGREEGR